MIEADSYLTPDFTTSELPFNSLASLFTLQLHKPTHPGICCLIRQRSGPTMVPRQPTLTMLRPMRARWLLSRVPLEGLNTLPRRQPLSTDALAQANMFKIVCRQPGFAQSYLPERPCFR
jgi:hypothetical protein